MRRLGKSRVFQTGNGSLSADSARWPFARLFPSFLRRKGKPMGENALSFRQRFHAIKEVPSQVKVVTTVAIVAVVIAAIALIVAVGSARNGRN